MSRGFAILKTNNNLISAPQSVVSPESTKWLRLSFLRDRAHAIIKLDCKYCADRLTTTIH